MNDKGQSASDQRIAELEREVTLSRQRVDAAEAAAAEWRMTQQRTLWKVFVAVDRARERIAPPRTLRDRLARSVARRIASAGSRPRRVRTEPRQPTGHKAVLLVHEQPAASTRYRCEHAGEQLELLGITFDIAQSDELQLARASEHYEFFVLHRVKWSRDVAALVKRAASLGKPVVFETDDLIIEPGASEHFAFLDNEGEHQREAWHTQLRLYREALLACDRAIVSTEPLRGHALRHCRKAEVAFNVVSREMVQAAAVAHRGTPSRDHGTSDVRIAYFSGTRTHSRDFLQAADAIVWALKTYPHVGFLLVGKLDLDDRFGAFGDRVVTVPKRPWQELPELMSTVDINLAPLEPDNPFTECKSCVKFLEAALLGVPTVASPRPDFERVITHGRNGLLAESPAEWQDAIRQLIESPHLRHELGQHAYDEVRRNHTTSAHARRFRGVMRSVGKDIGRPPLAVNWLVPATQMSEGGATRLALGALLAERGHDVRFHVAGDDYRAFAEALGSVGMEVRPGRLESADVTVATDKVIAPIAAAHEDSLLKVGLCRTLDEACGLIVGLLPVCFARAVDDGRSAANGRPVERIEVDLGEFDGGDVVTARSDARLRDVVEHFETVLLEACFLRINRAGGTAR
jgi:glycosyltransferase involved in cell wall biosynthesis